MSIVSLGATPQMREIHKSKNFIPRQRPEQTGNRLHDTLSFDQTAQDIEKPRELKQYDTLREVNKVWNNAIYELALHQTDQVKDK